MPIILQLIHRELNVTQIHVSIVIPKESRYSKKPGLCYIIYKGIKEGYPGYLIFDFYIKDFILPWCINNFISMNCIVRIFLL